MFEIDFDRPVHAHFIGIGGVSMSGLAVILRSKGFTVSGSDSHLGPATEKLQDMGIKIYEGNRAENLSPAPDVVVYTAAVHPDNPEFIRAKELGIPMLTRASLLGQVMSRYGTAICVSGTHGKTTATSMLTYVLVAAEKEPTVSVGGNLSLIGGNILLGSDDLFVAEACEYTNSFLSFFPDDAIVLNVEADHLDFFKDLDDIRSSFAAFLALVPEDGHIVIGGDIKDHTQLTDGARCRQVITFGSPSGGSDYTYSSKTLQPGGCYSFTVEAPGKPSGKQLIELAVPGEHNILNALAVIAESDALGIDPAVTAKALATFTGTERRFQKKGEICGVTVVDDYAHHPQEIAATLSAARGVTGGRVVVAFQPHTYSRTKALFDDFTRALCGADEVLLAPIYAARETDDLGMSSGLLSGAIRKAGTPSSSFDSFSELEDYVLTHLMPGDLLITMGAGDIYKAGEDLIHGTDKH